MHFSYLPLGRSLCCNHVTKPWHLKCCRGVALQRTHSKLMLPFLSKAFPDTGTCTVAFRSPLHTSISHFIITDVEAIGMPCTPVLITDTTSSSLVVPSISKTARRIAGLDLATDAHPRVSFKMLHQFGSRGFSL